ncbi:hypothetical protein P7C70_g8573, partial [Phenoliferia sp. Uapishka_3]
MEYAPEASVEFHKKWAFLKVKRDNRNEFWSTHPVHEVGGPATSTPPTLKDSSVYDLSKILRDDAQNDVLSKADWESVRARAQHKIKTDPDLKLLLDLSKSWEGQDPIKRRQAMHILAYWVKPLRQGEDLCWSQTLIQLYCKQRASNPRRVRGTRIDENGKKRRTSIPVRLCFISIGAHPDCRTHLRYLFSPSCFVRYPILTAALCSSLATAIQPQGEECFSYPVASPSHSSPLHLCLFKLHRLTHVSPIITVPYSTQSLPTSLPSVTDDVAHTAHSPPVANPPSSCVATETGEPSEASVSPAVRQVPRLLVVRL